MVVFTCNHCGESLQKPRVEKHYSTTCCRNPKSLTCVDCLKDFRLEEYAVHTKCITETERYSAKGTVVGVPKGEKKQQSWIETVQHIIKEQKDKVGHNILKVFEVIEKHNNIPKKKKPFINFLTSASAGRIKPQDLEAVWNILEEHSKKSTNVKEKSETNGKQNDSPQIDAGIGNNNEIKKKKKKKSKDKKSINDTNGESVDISEKEKQINGNDSQVTDAGITNIGKIKKKKKDKSKGKENSCNVTNGESVECNKKERTKKSEEIQENIQALESVEFEVGTKEKNDETSEIDIEKSSNKKMKRKLEVSGSNSILEETDKQTLQKVEEAEKTLKNDNSFKADVELHDVNNEEIKKKKKKKSIDNENSFNGTTNEKVENSKIDETKNSESLKKKQKKILAQESEDPENKTNEINTDKFDEINEKSPSKKIKRKLGAFKNGETDSQQDTTSEQIPPKIQKVEEIESENTEEFSWEKTITEILQKKPKGIAKNKLENKVFKKYKKVKGIVDNKKFLKKYDKKLKLLNIIHDNELVKLVN